jgi:hypothetical protein
MACALFSHPCSACSYDKELVDRLRRNPALARRDQSFRYRLVAWLNDLSVTVHNHRSDRDRRRADVLCTETTRRLLFSRASPLTQRATHTVGIRDRLVAGDVDIHRLRRLGECFRRDRRSAPSSALGHGHGSRRFQASSDTCFLIALTLAIKDIGAVLSAKDSSGNDVPAVLAILIAGLGEKAGHSFQRLLRWRCGFADCLP